MLTGSQYKKSLFDGRAIFFEGERIEDLPRHPIIGQSVDQIARGYDRWYSPEAGALNPLMSIPHSCGRITRAHKTAAWRRHPIAGHLSIGHDSDNGRRAHRREAAEIS